MEIIHKYGAGKGKFLARDGNETIGEMIYLIETPQVMAIEHTEVKASERGNNVGIQLLDFAVEYVREHNMQIRPVCSFVNLTFRRNADKYIDVTLKPDL